MNNSERARKCIPGNVEILAINDVLIAQDSVEGFCGEDVFVILGLAPLNVDRPLLPGLCKESGHLDRGHHPLRILLSKLHASQLIGLEGLLRKAGRNKLPSIPISNLKL